MAESNWDNVEKLIRRPQQSAVPAPSIESDRPLAVIDEKIDKIRGQQVGLIGKFKSNSISRKAALEGLREMHAAQLEAAKHALRRAVDVEKSRIDAVANKYIFQITEEYLKFFREMGIQNYESRMETLLDLNTTMARLLKKAEGQDVPPTAKDATIQNIMKKYEEFANRIMEEELRLK